MTDLFETITKADDAKWPFPRDRKSADRLVQEALAHRELAPKARAAIDAEVALTVDPAGPPLNQRCPNCFFKGRDVCLCYEKFANPEHADVGTPSRINEPPPTPLPTRASWNGLPDGPAMVLAMASPACNANILALDLGTKTGWALGLRDGKVRSGSESFAARRNEGPGQRWLKFQAWLGEQYRAAGELQAIYYEIVMAHGPRDQPNTLAAHVYGGFEAFLQAFADRNRIQLVGVGVGTIKKSATGKGNAKKEAVIAAMRARGHRVIDDNHGDALALLEYARQQEA
ncbi:hypothetical protein DFLDMN_000295 [Cupriavidus sp. H19C3]|uniref:hypothetical protein n=1 Tax=Cupriavidus sp. H19C3 TaxID=3241603 RepID=UPI003BF8EAD6